jgi:S-adenosylmethionine hydrolase
VIVLFTDFGPSGPYLGQMQAVLQQQSPDTAVIDLVNNAPTANPQLSSYLLAALRFQFPKGSVFLSVVDPGVGGERLPVVLEADGQFFVGPDNGLLNTVAGQSKHSSWQQIVWQPENCSMSFHGRDIFAPVAARLVNSTAENLLTAMPPVDLSGWPSDLAKLIYFDHYGNAWTGVRYHQTMAGMKIICGDQKINQAQTFRQVKKGCAFWYQNSSGLIEIAVNQGHAQQQFHLDLDTPINFL